MAIILVLNFMKRVFSLLSSVNFTMTTCDHGDNQCYYEE